MLKTTSALYNSDASSYCYGIYEIASSKYETRKIIDGSIFSSDPWRVHTLMLIAIGKTGDVQIVSEPQKMMALARGLAVAGLPKVIEMLKDGDAEPIWNLSDAVDGLLRKEKAS